MTQAGSLDWRVRAGHGQTLDALRARLAESRNADGGWGYAAGRRSRIEPTCWALLALARVSRSPVDTDILSRWPTADGWMVDVERAPVNCAFNALAALTLLTRPQGAVAARAMAARLVQIRGLRLEPAAALRQDNSLQAWPWIDGTFSWVEPTGWCLLLLKKLRSGRAGAETDERIRIGEQMLRDRVCRAGGWNYGSSNVYGQELFAYVPTTAIGLLAMQDRRDDPVVVRSLETLQRMSRSERSPIALSLAAVALRAYGTTGDTLLPPLAALFGGGRPVDDVMGLAMALYALSGNGDGELVFAL